jgi:hypothetical protein
MERPERPVRGDIRFRRNEGPAAEDGEAGGRKDPVRRLLISGGLTVAIVYLVASALPAFGADNGTVSASVTAGAACITLSQTAPVDFGTKDFSTSAGNSAAGQAAGSITNCATQTESILAKGTDASNGATTWSLVDATGLPTPVNPCDLASPNTNKYFLSTFPGALSTVLLSTTNKAFHSLAAGASSSLTVAVVMPCTGSSGAGQTLNFSYVYTATF